MHSPITSSRNAVCATGISPTCRQTSAHIRMTMIMNATMIMVVSMRPLVAKTASRRGLYGGHADRNGYVRPYRGSGGSLLGGADRALAAEFPHRHGIDAAGGHLSACTRQARRRRGELRTWASR